nr:unnamed protein product [Digitaria exilis]
MHGRWPHTPWARKRAHTREWGEEKQLPVAPPPGKVPRSRPTAEPSRLGMRRRTQLPVAPPKPRKTPRSRPTAELLRLGTRGRTPLPRHHPRGAGDPAPQTPDPVTLATKNSPGLQSCHVAVAPQAA